MTTCKNEYKDFFDAAKKIMHSDSMLRAEEKAERILLALRLSDLQDELKLPQTEIDELSQIRIPKIENKKDMKISTLIRYCKALGMGVEIKAVPIKDNKTISKILLRSI